MRLLKAILLRAGALSAIVLASAILTSCGSSRAARPIPPVIPPNAIVAENSRIGTEGWRLAKPAGRREIEGYASSTSVNRGEAIRLYVNTEAPAYTLEVFRMGWYQGLGGRRVFGPLKLPGVVQVTPAPDPLTGLVDCDWRNPYLLSTKGEGGSEAWTSGVYLAKLTESSGQRQSYIFFVVRDDDRPADLLVQIPVTTYQAYNFWGGKSLYSNGSGLRLPWGSTAGAPAVKVSFNRPYAASTNPKAAYGVGAGSFLTNDQPVTEGYPISSAAWDYNMVRWLEREGFDLAYMTSVDTHASPGLLKSHKGFLSTGHDEYWSWPMRDHLERARDAGLNLAFFGANAVYWQIRFEESPVTATPDRVMVSYKNQSDPYERDTDLSRRRFITVRWHSQPISRPEDQLIGVGYLIDPVDGDIVVSNGSHWVFENTGLTNGSRLTGLLGYEVDGVQGNQPATTEILATSPAVDLSDSRHTAISNMTIYTTAAGSLVFATGSIQWSWGLDDFNAPLLRTSRMSPAAQQITRNVLARFGALPALGPSASAADESPRSRD